MWKCMIAAVTIAFFSRSNFKRVRGGAMLGHSDIIQFCGRVRNAHTLSLRRNDIGSFFQGLLAPTTLLRRRTMSRKGKRIF